MNALLPIIALGSLVEFKNAGSFVFSHIQNILGYVRVKRRVPEGLDPHVRVINMRKATVKIRRNPSIRFLP